MKNVGAYVLAALLGLAGIALAWDRLDLLPPERVRIASGPAGGGYHGLSERYAALLAEDGIEAEVIVTRGSVENVELLGTDRADVALVQGGVPVAMPEGVAPAEAIAALFVEPLLLFAGGGRTVSADPTDWARVRVAVGPEGSGTRFAWRRLETAMGLTGEAVRPDPRGGSAAADALLAGEVDLAAFVAPIEAAYLAPLFDEPRIGLLALERISALERRLPEFVRVTLPAGAIDYAGRVPDRDVALLAAPARMIARDGLHPALVNRLVRAARIIHGPPGLLSGSREFPSLRAVDAPLNPHARALIEDGPSPLEELLPYWVAAQINSFLLLLLPVLFLVVPLMRAIPGIYEYTVRRRVFRHYRTLREIDLDIAAARDPAELEALDARLDAVEDALRAMKLPLAYREHAYFVRSHVELVRQRIADRRHRLAARQA